MKQTKNKNYLPIALILEMSDLSSNSNECNLQNIDDDEGVSEGHSGQTNGEHSVAQCSTASAPKDIKFNIHHKYTTHNIVVSERSTIGLYNSHSSFSFFSLLKFVRFK